MAALISAVQRTFLRNMAARGFTDTVTIQTHSTTNIAGGEADVWTTTATTTGWLKQTNTPQLEQVGEGEIAAVGVYRLLLPWNTAVNPGDQVIVGSNTYLMQNTNVEDTNRISLVCTVRLIETN